MTWRRQFWASLVSQLLLAIAVCVLLSLTGCTEWKCANACGRLGFHYFSSNTDTVCECKGGPASTKPDGGR